MICEKCQAKLPVGKVRCPSCSYLNSYNIKGHVSAKSIQDALSTMISEQADNITDRVRFIALMFDYLPGREIECNILKKAVDAGFLEEVINADEKSKKLAIVGIRSKLMHDLNFNRDDAEFVLACFSHMFGLPYVSALMIDDEPSIDIVSKVEVPDIPVSIKPKVFGKMDAFKYKLSSRVIIKDGYTEIAGYCFDTYGRMREISIPDTINTIGEYAFSDCKNLESIEIPDSVKKIGKGVFNACVGLKRIKLPVDLLTINDNSFFCCMALKALKIPDKVSSIGENAFSGCVELEKLIISKNVKFIDTGAFTYCKKVMVICPENSFMHRYCIQNKIKFETVVDSEHLPEID